MSSLFRQLVSHLPRLTWLEIVDIVVVAFLIYQFLMIIRGRRAAHILTGVGVLAVIYGISALLGLRLLSSMLGNVAPYAPFAIIVMFQSEIRRMLARIGRQRFRVGGRLQRREFTEEIVLAMSRLSKTETGALVVIERDIGLRTFIESGIGLDAALSSDLLTSIFQTSSVLHDGAVIIQGDRIASAACFLPLTVRPVLSRKLGTRHRAAIGVTEETDCLSLIVSEETGHMSVAAFGEIEFDVDEKRLAERINEHLVQKRWTRQQNDMLDEFEGRMERQTAHDSRLD
jgi:diadenylate cyclase